MDLYLAPRARKMRLTIQPEDLVPQLPRPQDLQPFPTVCSITYTVNERISMRYLLHLVSNQLEWKHVRFLEKSESVKIVLEVCLKLKRYSQL